MALPKKRKKLESKEEESTTEIIDEKKEELVNPLAAGSKSVSEAKFDEVMVKAFEVMEKVEGCENVSGPKACSLNKKDFPGRIRVRITLDGRFQKLGKSFQGLIENSGNPIGVDLKFPIPSFFWKVPIFVEIAKLVIRKLYPVA